MPRGGVDDGALMSEALAAWGRGSRDAETLANLRELRAEAERIGLDYALPALVQVAAADRTA